MLARLLALSTLLAACGGRVASSDHSVDASVPGDGAAPRSGVRFANFASFSPSFDVCYRNGAGNMAGPLLAGQGSPSGLGYGQLSDFTDVEPGTVEFGIVAVGAVDCESPLNVQGAARRTQPVPPGAFVTIALVKTSSSTGNTTGFAVYGFMRSPVPGEVSVQLDNLLPLDVELDARSTGAAAAPIDGLVNVPPFGSARSVLSLASNRTFEVHPANVTKALLESPARDTSVSGEWTVFTFGDPADGTARMAVCNDALLGGKPSGCR